MAALRQDNGGYATRRVCATPDLCGAMLLFVVRNWRLSLARDCRAMTPCLLLPFPCYYQRAIPYLWLACADFKAGLAFWHVSLPW